MSGNLLINWVTQLNLHCFQLRMMFIWLLLKVRLLLSFSWINQQRLILLIMIHYLILLAPGLVWAGLSLIGLSLISQTVFSALRLGQFYLMPKSFCMVCLKALSWGQSFFHSILLHWVKSYGIILVLVSSSTLMTHNCMYISHIKMLPRPLISCHTALKT